MAFFKKLKERLFKSSSKIDEGLEAIVEDGGTEDTLHPQDVQAGSADPGTPDPEPQPIPSDPEPVPTPREEPVAPPVETPEEPPSEVPAPPPEEPVEPTPTPPEEPDPTPTPPSEPEPTPPEIAPEPPRAPDPTPPEIDPEPAPVEVPFDPEPVPSPPEANLDTAKPVELPQRPAPAASELAQPTSASAKTGILDRILGRSAAKTVVRRVLDDEMLEQLEELLIASDMGVDTALRVTANMAEGRVGRKLSVEEIKRLLSDEIARIMAPVAKPLPLYPRKPQVVLVVGVNGSGKTTTIGKLASQFRGAGKKVVIAAGDTFRAAAVEQLQVWGDRAGVPVLTAPEGSDPASLAFDAMTKAQAEGADLLLIDTAGRLQNRSDLMEELAKIVRVIRKKDPDAPHNTLLVLDATTGQNALNQVKVFSDISDVSGLVMTKLDGTAKGGVLVALADKFGLPIHAIGIGEQIDDLDAFDPQEFADALIGLER